MSRKSPATPVDASTQAIMFLTGGETPTVRSSDRKRKSIYTNEALELLQIIDDHMEDRDEEWGEKIKPKTKDTTPKRGVRVPEVPKSLTAFVLPATTESAPGIPYLLGSQVRDLCACFIDLSGQFIAWNEPWISLYKDGWKGRKVLQCATFLTSIRSVIRALGFLDPLPAKITLVPLRSIEALIAQDYPHVNLVLERVGGGWDNIVCESTGNELTTKSTLARLRRESGLSSNEDRPEQKQHKERKMKKREGKKKLAHSTVPLKSPRVIVEDIKVFDTTSFATDDRDHAIYEIQSRFSALYRPKTPYAIRGLDDQRSEIMDLLNRTLNRGENHSVMLVGPRGSGKTYLLDTCIEYVLNDRMKVVTLNGLVHATDAIALNDLCAQLSVTKQVNRKHFDTYADVIGYAVGLVDRPVIVRLDEFDIFAQRPRQVLLYSLFELVKSSEVNLTVICSTVRIDALDMLEKRVRSRFSQRQIRFSCPLSLPSLIDIMTHHLTLTDESSSSVEYIAAHNTTIERVLSEPVVHSTLLHRFRMSTSVPSAFAILRDAVSHWRSSADILFDTTHMKFALRDTRNDATLAILLDLSVVELYLLVTMQKLREKRQEPFNSVLVYDEYSQFAMVGSTGFTQRRAELYSKPVCMGAIEHLMELQLVGTLKQSRGAYVAASGRDVREYQQLRLLLPSSLIHEALIRYPDCPTVLRQWGTRWATGE